MVDTFATAWKFRESAEAIEKALNEAEDRGARQPMRADADTIEALQRLVRETLEPMLDADIPPAKLDHRAANIAQVIIANFHIRLMDEDDEEQRGAGR